MIKQLQLKNWKSFTDATLFIDPLTILIGANASGKSNALDALLFLQRLSSGAGIFQAINGDSSLPGLRGGLEWICRKPAKEFSLVALLDGPAENKEYRFSITIGVNEKTAEVVSEKLALLTYRPRSDTPRERVLYQAKQEKSTNPAIPAYFYTGTQGRGRRLDLNRSHLVLSQTGSLNIRKEIVEGAKCVGAQFRKTFVFNPVPSHMRDYSAFSEYLFEDGSNIAGVLAGLPKKRKDEVEKKLTEYLRSIPEKDLERVWTEPVGKFETDAMLYCEEGWQGDSKHLMDARGMSDGTLRYLAIVTAVLTRDPDSLLVVEEVDNGLHPSRADDLIQMLRTLGKERRIDIVITTHNPALLDAAGARMVPFITVVHRDRKTGESRLTQLEDIHQLPKLMASGPLGRLTAEGRVEAAVQEGEQK